jgi:uncharacterized repeat protein (TIGR04138 family)
MLGQPDPIVPVRSADALTSGSNAEFKRAGFVSIWVGTFASVEDAEAYFGIPDEIGVPMPAEAFAGDFGLGDFPPETLEVNFEQVAKRPLVELLRDATFAACFVDQALEAATRQGIAVAQGVALLYEFDYRLKAARRDVAGPLRFIGAFPFVQFGPRANLQPVREVTQEIGCPVGVVLFVIAALVDARTQRQRERGGEAGHMTARDYCEYLLRCRGEDTAAVLRELGLRRSEDVGRIMFGLVKKGLVRRQESDAESDFAGLFVLD